MVREGMTAAITVKVQAPVFESQTKNKLGNTDVRAWIVPETKAAVDNYLRRNPDMAKMLLAKIEANEKLRTELNSVKKEAKEAAKRISIRIPKLKDCKYHVQDGKKGEESMIFITEGESASGTMTHSRDANYQAIFSLRGKPENMYGRKQSEIYKNDELYQLMMALGIENSVENLKYSKNFKEEQQCISLRCLISLGIATSIDALAVGISFAFLEVNVWTSSIMIGIASCPM